MRVQKLCLRPGVSQFLIAKNNMKRIIPSLMLLAVTVVWGSSQQSKPSSTVTGDEFQKVLIAVSNEDWDTAAGLSAKYLKQMKIDDERLPRLRYIYLYSAAGKVSEGKMEFDDLAQSAKEFVGKSVALPYRPITFECRGALNFICLSKDSKTNYTEPQQTKLALQSWRLNTPNSKNLSILRVMRMRKLLSSARYRR
jgi:hypothetical protein